MEIGTRFPICPQDSRYFSKRNSSQMALPLLKRGLASSAPHSSPRHISTRASVRASSLVQEREIIDVDDQEGQKTPTTAGRCASASTSIPKGVHPFGADFSEQDLRDVLTSLTLRLPTPSLSTLVF